MRTVYGMLKRMRWFASVLDAIFPPRTDERLVRAAMPDDIVSFLSPVMVPTVAPPVTALLSFGNPLVRAAVHEAKYHGNEKATELLARALSDYLIELLAEERGAVLLPMPLSKRRLRERGFNQCEKIAAALRDVSVPIRNDLLLRVRDTEHQTRLAREARKENLRGAFRAAEVLDPDRSYLLLDDVVTTGATMQAAIDALRDAGALRIIPIALAH